MKGWRLKVGHRTRIEEQLSTQAQKKDPPVEARIQCTASSDGPFGYLFLATGPARYPR
jgi:hypothetical protein